MPTSPDHDPLISSAPSPDAESPTTLTSQQAAAQDSPTPWSARPPAPPSTTHDRLAPVSEWSAIFAGMLSALIHTSLIGLRWALLRGRPWLLAVAWATLTSFAAARADRWLDIPSRWTSWLYLGGWALALQPSFSIGLLLVDAARESLHR